MFGRQRARPIAHIYQLKRELMEFRRAVVPLQRPMAALVEDKELLPKGMRRYFRDVNEHLLRAVERVSSYDDLLNSILQARLAQVTVDQNNDMRKIAAWAAIAAIQTAIAGIYGMNFNFMPELGGATATRSSCWSCSDPRSRCTGCSAAAAGCNASRIATAWTVSAVQRVMSFCSDLLGQPTTLDAACGPKRFATASPTDLDPDDTIDRRPARV